MNRRWWWMGLVVLLAACASVPRQVEVSRAQLQAALDKRFPVERRFLEFLDVRAAGPLVALMPSGNRLGVELTLTATDRASRIPVEGFVAMSFMPRYEPADATIRMTQVRVDKLDFGRAIPAWRVQLERLGSVLGEAMLEGAVLHAFPQEEIARARGWAPSDIRVTARGVTITLQPPN